MRSFPMMVMFTATHQKLYNLFEISISTSATKYPTQAILSRVFNQNISLNPVLFYTENLNEYCGAIPPTLLFIPFFSF